MNGLLIAAALGTAGILCREALYRSNLCFAIPGDEDMKIASPGSFSQKKQVEDASEREARMFLEQKSCGNIDKARQLGEVFAQKLLDKASSLLDGQGQIEPRQHQYLVLYSYAVNRAIADFSPNSILAQTSLNVFYDILEQKSPELHRHVSDMAAFSLYILCERSHNCSDDEIGRIYARLIGLEGEGSAVDEGNTLFRRFYQYCGDEYGKVEYALVSL